MSSHHVHGPARRRPQNQDRNSKQKSRARRRSRKLTLEFLEDRRLLAVRTWDGGAGGNLSDASNWVGGVAPVAGDDLVFPELNGSALKTLTNNGPAGTRFNTIQISGRNYSLGGNAIELSGGLTANTTYLDPAANPGAVNTNAVGVGITLVNAQSFYSANAGTTLTLTGTIDTANLPGTTNILGTSALTLDGSGSLNFTSTSKITGYGSVTKLGDGTATLAGANDYLGITDVRQGILVAANAKALGDYTTGDTQVQAGAQLQLAGGYAFDPEPFAITQSGVGLGNGTSTASLGALLGTGAGLTNQWTGPIEMVSNTLIGVDTGSTLNISGRLSRVLSNTDRLIKVGGGALQLTGTESNIHRGETRVLGGTLELGKTGGAVALGGNVIVGDDLEANGTETLRLLNDEQLPHTDYFGVALTSVDVRSTGVFDVNGKTETVGNVTLYTGVTDSADVDLKDQTNNIEGTLILGGAGVTVTAFQGSSGVTPAATISGGTLNLDTFYSGSGGGITKTFAVNDTQLGNLATDLHISAAIVGGTTTSITKTGGGSLRLSADNGPTFAGPFIHTAGYLEIADHQALGSGLFAVTAAYVTPFGADLTGANSIANQVSLDGNPVFYGSYDIAFTGLATLTGGRTITVMDPAQAVTFSGGITESIFGTQNFAKSGRGTLAITAPATYSGTTTINSDGGTLELSGTGSIVNSSAITVGVNATLKLDNSATVVGNRINDLTNVTNNGRLLLVGSGSADATETIGVLTPGQHLTSVVEIQDTPSDGRATVLTASRLESFSDRHLRLVGTGTALSATGEARVELVNTPGNLDDGILPQVIVYSPDGADADTNPEFDFATIASVTAGVAVVPLPATGYLTDVNQAGPSSNLKISGSQVLSLTRTVNAVLLEDGADLSGAYPLTVNSGFFGL